MKKFSSVFGQILQIFSKAEFYKAGKELKAEKGAKGFSCWEQFVAMLFCQLNLFSYRDLWEWLDNPFETPPIAPGGEQLVLGLR